MDVLVRWKNKLFFKKSHLDKEYDSITLKRLEIGISNMQLNALNNEPPKIPKRKYEDLISLCIGQTPVVRLPECKQFYRSLPHDQQ